MICYDENSEKQNLGCKMSVIKIIVMVVLPSLLLSACGPQYRTVARVAAPQTNQQVACLNSCDSVNNICQRSCNRNESRCYDLHQFSNFGKYRYTSYYSASPLAFSNCDFIGQDCRQACTRNNLLCYSRCGLKVTTTKECVANCDEQ